jgi:flagellar hook protein FlgE
MLRSLSSAVSGLQQFQQSIDVIGNNIANVNTIAYKGARATSSDSFSDSLQDAVGNSVQVGTGVTTGAVNSLFTQGGLQQTEDPANLMIGGQGFFVVKDTATGNTYATRDGTFSVTPEGYLVNPQGFRVQGYSDAALAVRGDLKIDDTGAPPPTIAGARNWHDFKFDSDGKLQVTLEDGTSFTRGQVLLQGFTSPQALEKAGNNLYTNLSAAGPMSQAQAPKTKGLGTITGGWLESSNVDLAGEFASLITAQRGFQANSRIITTSDELLQEVINLKR